MFRKAAWLRGLLAAEKSYFAQDGRIEIMLRSPIRSNAFKRGVLDYIEHTHLLIALGDDQQRRAVLLSKGLRVRESIAVPTVPDGKQLLAGIRAAAIHGGPALGNTRAVKSIYIAMIHQSLQGNNK